MSQTEQMRRASTVIPADWKLGNCPLCKKRVTTSESYDVLYVGNKPRAAHTECP